MTQNYGKNSKIARNEAMFNNNKKWCNHLDYTTFLCFIIVAYLILLHVFKNRCFKKRKTFAAW